jgi:serine/threonine protein phosphatase PrpC
MRKVNQDSFLVLKDFAGFKDLYMLGVMDGHGVFGHTVSQFTRTNLPIILNGLVKGNFRSEMSLAAGKI